MEDFEAHAEELGFDHVKTSIKCRLCEVYYAGYLGVQLEMTFYLCPGRVYNLTGKIRHAHKM